MMMTARKMDIVDHASLLFRWRRFILMNCLICCILAAVVSLIVPNWYASETTIFPPMEDSSDLGIGSLLNKIPLGGLGLGLGAVSEEATMFMAVLNSRTLMESTVQKFDLQKRYKSKNMEESIRELRKHISIKLNEEGTITVRASAATGFFPGRKDKDEARALSKDISNFTIDELDRINKGLKTERASNTRRFIEKRYLQNIQDLAEAEERLKEFQQKSGIVDLPTQTASIIKAVAEIKAQMLVKEINLNVLRETYGQANVEAVTLQKELKELKKKYSEMISQTDEMQGGLKDPFLSVKSLPQVGVAYARLYREVVMQQTIMEFLLPQYEQAKIQEAKDTPTVQILDRAVAPVKRAKPKRVFFVLFVGFVIAGLSAAYAEWREYYFMLRDSRSDRYKKLDAMRDGLRKDMSQLFKRRK